MSKKGIIHLVETKINELEPLLKTLADKMYDLGQRFLDAGFKRKPLWFDCSNDEDELLLTKYALNDLYKIRVALNDWNIGDEFYYEHESWHEKEDKIQFMDFIHKENSHYPWQVIINNQLHILEIKRRVDIIPSPMMLAQMNNDLLERRTTISKQSERFGQNE